MVKSLSRVRLFMTPWTVAHQAPPSMGFSRQEYWSGLSFPSPGDLLNPGIKPGSPALQAESLPSEPPGKPRILIEVSYHISFRIVIKTTSLFNMYHFFKVFIVSMFWCLFCFYF